MEKSSDLVGIILLVVLVSIIFTLPKDDWQGDLISPVSNAPETSTPASSGSSSYELRTASQAAYISLGSGNAAYSYQPYEEYITIDNVGLNSVDITGWQLRNGKDKRPYYSGNTLQRFSADVAVLPAITLAPGERAVVTTGRVGVQSPIKIGNFRENMCTGYIEALPDYAFIPPLTQNCPRPALEPGIENMDRECRDFITYLPSCQTPRFETRDSEGDPCDTCINGKRLSSVCAMFIKEHFNYPACLATHGNKENFWGRTWRIFLGRGWEMWADKYETIELFNSSGQLVDYENY